ncbi:hypothetical protein N561_06055 [Gallibacterium anatis 12656/12]|uniref:Uncharacterized protein n=1 Tax=Gallibacterium anatis 12656/12 TaxID=1195244 RepID=U1H1Z9_9PAST|nr:hypothetical protein N561_06055 [Gallibacterium anatis 12656/12]
MLSGFQYIFKEKLRTDFDKSAEFLIKGMF